MRPPDVRRKDVARRKQRNRGAQVISAEEAAKFARWLQRDQRLTENTARSYLRDIRMLAGADDPVEALKDIAHPASQVRPRAALKAWARYRNDRDLMGRIELLPKLRGIAQTLSVHLPFSDRDFKAMARAVPEVATTPAELFGLTMLFLSGARCYDVVSGVRRDELAASVTTGTDLVIYTKGTKTRVVDWHPQLRQRALPLVRFTGWTRLADLWNIDAQGGRRGKRLTVDSAAAGLRQLVYDLGKMTGAEQPVHPHRLRRTVAVRFWQANPDLEELLRFMGWSSQETALRYIRRLGLSDLRKKIRALAVDVG